MEIPLCGSWPTFEPVFGECLPFIPQAFCFLVFVSINDFIPKLRIRFLGAESEIPKRKMRVQGSE
jgi:hypothetical protein